MKTYPVKLAALALSVFFIAETYTGASAEKNSKSLKSEISSAMESKMEFDFDEFDVRETYHSQLDLLANEVKKTNRVVLLHGHADAIGEYVYNWKLSERRAQEVMKYLVSKGIDERRIVITPFGSTKPIADNGTADGRQRNRRVEVIFRN